MAKKNTPKEASQLFENIMKASVKGNPKPVEKPKNKDNMTALDELVNATKQNIDVIIDKYVEAYKQEKSIELIEKFKREVAQAITMGIVHKAVGSVDAGELTEITRKVNLEAGEKFNKEIASL